MKWLINELSKYNINHLRTNNFNRSCIIPIIIKLNTTANAKIIDFAKARVSFTN